MNMSEEEDCDDLPPITVNSSVNNSSTFAMPTAEELVEQRARERECERQLELLRQRARDDEQRDDEQRAAARRDSSGSEAERALAAAVTALRVRAARPAASVHAPRAAALWAALRPRLPPLAARLAWRAPAAQCARAVLAVGAALAGARAWPDDELLCAGALLSVAALARESRSRRAAARALHALLDERASPAQAAQLTAALLAALPAARARLQLSDALRSGGRGGADRAAFALCGAAMLDLLRAPAQDGEEAVSLERVARAASAWRAFDADTRYVCVQLTGRLLAATSGATDATSASSNALDSTCATSSAMDATSATSSAMDSTSSASSTIDAMNATSATSSAMESTNATSSAMDATSATSSAMDSTSSASSTIDAMNATSATSSAMESTNATSSAMDATSATQEVRSCLLAHLAPPPGGARDAQRPDRLKAAVGASKLKLLFGAKHGISKQPRAQQDTAT